MPGAFADIITGLVTAIISGGAVWLWQRGNRTRRVRRKAAFFGVRAGQACLVVMNRHWQSPRAVARSDVYALLDIGSLVDELSGKIDVRSSDELREGIGDRTEFCIGGPDSNPRTAAHLASFLPGVVIHPYSETGAPVVITTGGDRFVRDPEKREFAIVARISPSGAARPVFVISGQTSITNRAAVHFLRQHYVDLAKTIGTRDQFCLIVGVTSPDVYGHQLVDLEKDVTATAFPASSAPRLSRGAPGGHPGLLVEQEEPGVTDDQRAELAGQDGAEGDR